MFDLDLLKRLIAAHGTIARVVVAGTKGSTPREVGASVAVWADGQSGTIGGGRLEYQAVQRARTMLARASAPRVDRAALGPAMNQCCGGAVTLVTEVFDTAVLGEIAGKSAFARPVEPGAGEIPAQMKRAISRTNALGSHVAIALSHGWLVEPLERAKRQIVIYGAGHVGQALASTLAPLPDFDLVVADQRAGMLDLVHTGVRTSQNPLDTLAAAPDDAAHLIMTHAHDLDLALCHAVLGRPFHSVGLIGSATKWARFRKRLLALGHTPAQVARIRCPIGDPSLGKHPQAIAVGVTADLIRMTHEKAQSQEAC